MERMTLARGSIGAAVECPLDNVKSLLIEELMKRDVPTGDGVGLLLKIEKLPLIEA
jgi:hypothetical protein